MCKIRKIKICMLIISMLTIYLAGCNSEKKTNNETMITVLTTTPIITKLEDTKEPEIDTYEINELFGDSILGLETSKIVYDKNNVTLEELAEISDVKMTFYLSELKGIKYLTGLKKLKVNIIDFGSYQDTVEIFEELNNINNLEEVYIECFEFTQENKVAAGFVKTIENMESIKTISFRNWQKIDTGLLSNFNNTEYLAILFQDSDTRSIDLSGIAKMQSLETLDIRGNEYLENLTGIEKLINLKSLTLFNNNIQDLSFICSLTNLEYLDLCGNSNLSVNEYEKLRNLKNLKVLEIGYREENEEIVDLSFVEELEKIEELVVTGKHIENVAKIRNLSNLKSLEVYYFQSENLEFIDGLDNLEYLGLIDTSLYDISILQDLPSLKTLDISGSKLESEDAFKIIEELKAKGVEVIE